MCCRNQVELSVKENLEKDLHKNVGIEEEWKQILPSVRGGSR